MKRVEEYLKKAGAYYLATVEGDQPRVRPFGTAAIIDGRLCIQTGKKKDCYKQILANPKVELSAFLGDSWIRVTGKLALDDRRESKKEMLDQYPNLREMYSEDDDNTAVLAFTEGQAVIYSFTAAPEVISF